MISAVPAFSDNYIWIIRPDNDQESGATVRSEATVVDPGDAAPVIAYLKKNQLALGAILVTHHHADHVGGIDTLLDYAAQSQGIDAMPKVFGPASEMIPSVNVRLSEGNEVYLKGLKAPLRVIEVPGHTLGHIAYYGDIDGSGPCLFSGDTLFAAGCGRLFEGSAEQMWSSLQKFTALPEATRVFCAHEYTLSNLTFAAHAMPANADIAQRFRDVTAMCERGEITLPSTIGIEMRSNPFLLCRDEQEFAAMRKEKDGFRG